MIPVRPELPNISVYLKSINSINLKWLANVNYHGQMTLLLCKPPEKWKVFHKVNFAQKILYWPILALRYSEGSSLNASVPFKELTSVI